MVAESSARFNYMQITPSRGKLRSYMFPWSSKDVVIIAMNEAITQMRQYGMLPIDKCET